MSDTSETNSVVIGAGQAGLAASAHLSAANVPHVVLERGRVGESWRSARWDSFHLNTPNRFNALPDSAYDGDAPEGFAPRDELVRYLERYREARDLPIREGVEVRSVRADGERFAVETDDLTWRAQNVVMCSGDQNVPTKPLISSALPSDLLSLHTAEYRRSEQAPEGAVLVVGAGQSGVQIVEDLLEAGRKVWLCTSKVGRIPRRYRGKDVISWFEATGMADTRPEDLSDPAEIHARQGQISGTRGGHTVALQQLARDGVTLLGRLEGVRGRVLTIAGDLEENVAAGDAGAAKLRAGLDMFIEKASVDAPPHEPDPVEAPFDGIAEMAAIREVDLDDAGIRSVIWATGFGASFGYLDASLLDERGLPRHAHGVCPVPGLFCVGLKWQRRRVSGLILGVDEDARYVTEQIRGR